MPSPSGALLDSSPVDYVMIALYFVFVLGIGHQLGPGVRRAVRQGWRQTQGRQRLTAIEPRQDHSEESPAAEADIGVSRSHARRIQGLGELVATIHGWVGVARDSGGRGRCGRLCSCCPPRRSAAGCGAAW